MRRCLHGLGTLEEGCYPTSLVALDYLNACSYPPGGAVPGCFGFVFLCFGGICVLKVYDGRDAGVAPALLGFGLAPEVSLRPALDHSPTYCIC
jgi:hypothetical protein